MLRITVGVSSKNRSLFSAMKLPMETVLDCFRCLDRPSLDALQFSTKSFRYAVDKLSNVCLRFLLSASIISFYDISNFHEEPKTRSYRIRARQKRATPKDVRHKLSKETRATEEHAGECFAKLVVSSFVERAMIRYAHLTDRILQALEVSYVQNPTSDHAG